MSAPASSLPPVVRAIVDRLDLAPHPEGGFYRETWRSPVELARESLPAGYPGPRAAMTAILFLLPTGVSSALHRVRSEELWLHHQGDDVALGIGETIAAVQMLNDDAGADLGELVEGDGGDAAKVGGGSGPETDGGGGGAEEQANEEASVEVEVGGSAPLASGSIASASRAESSSTS